MQAFLPSYLELSLSSFTQQQERMRQQMASFGQVGGMGAYEDQIRQNMALFDRAMKMFSPFSFAPQARAEEPAPTAPPAKPETDEALTALRKQMAEMQAQLDRLAKS
jgi:polyhydroxyalkanoate synthesis regulator protein